MKWMVQNSNFILLKLYLHVYLHNLQNDSRYKNLSRYSYASTSRAICQGININMAANAYRKST
jgi:hypothetical protein